MRHQVFWSYKNDAPQEERLALEKELLALAKNDDSVADLGITQAEIQIYTSDEKLNQGYTHVLVFEFIDAGKRDSYLSHPRHAAVLEYLGAHPIVGMFMAFDYQPPLTPRRVLAAAEHILQQPSPDQKQLSGIASDLQSLIEKTKTNKSAFTIKYGNLIVTPHEQVSQNLHTLFGKIQTAIDSQSHDTTNNAIAKFSA